MSLLERIRRFLPRELWQSTRPRADLPFSMDSARALKESYENLRDLGLERLAQGDLQSASAILGEAMLIGDSLAEAHLNLGRVYRSIGRFEGARQAFSRARERDSSCVEALDELASLPAPPPVRPDFKEGQTLKGLATGNQWTVVDVKSGGYGVVCIAREHEDGKLYALKCLRTKYAWSDSDRERFEREAVTWIKLPPHPNIATAEWLERIEDQPCLVLEYVEGGDLGQLLARERLPSERAILLAIQFCDGMVFAHDCLGLVHRDIKSANCLLSAVRTLKVADFGLAHTLATSREASVGLGGFNPKVIANYTQPLGTPSYMAPEQLLVGEALDTRTDIHAFGVMFYEMLTRDLPQYKPQGGLLFGWQAHNYISARAHELRLSRPLIDFLLTCVDPEPAGRFDSFQAVRQELCRLCRTITRTRPPSPPQPPPVGADHWQNKAVAFQAIGRNKDALDCIDRGMEIEPDNRDLLLCRAAALYGLNRHLEALECCERGLKSDPRDADLWNNKGLALQGLDRFEDALDSFRRAKTLAPRDPVIFKNEGQLLCTLERLDDAVVLFQQGLSLDPHNPALLEALGFALVQRKPAEALDAFDKGCSIASRRLGLWKGKGMAHENLKQFDKAIEAYDKALEIHPDNFEVLKSRGMAYWSLANTEASGGRACAEKSISDLDRALKLRDDADVSAIRSYIARHIG